ncbi:ABC transporter permease [Bosea sp. 2KB_26]|uniref:ABC transporter permease n=1 Tax=Bosea sp. 2KB_26 TaxID=3237475 RepID=UPI003F8ED7C5
MAVAYRASALRFCGKLSRNGLGLIGLSFILLLGTMAIAAPLIAPYDPLAQDLTRRLMPPSWPHLCGTDELGRDIFSRIVWGARVTFRIIFLVSIIALPVGLFVGTVAGYLGGLVDIVLMRLCDVFLAVPGLVLALTLVSMLGPSLENAVIAIAATLWPQIARLARAETLIVRQADYVSVIRIQGARWHRIVLRHIVPMCVSSLIVRGTMNMATIILTAAGLGFLGLGVRPPDPEWGSMLATGREYMMDDPWIAAFPGLAILLTSLAFNLFGDALRDVLDPRS